MRITVHGRSIMRCVAASAVVSSLLMLAGCGGTPVRGVLEPPAPSQPAPSAATAAATAPAVVEATVTVVPTARGAYRVISVTVPKGVSSLAVIIPDAAAPATPPPAPAVPAQGGDKDCSGGIFSCSKLISETVTAVVAAIVALLGLIAMLRRSRSRKKK